MPPLVVESDSSPSTEPSSPAMAAFRKYCESCHVGEPYPFLEQSSEAAAWQAIAPLAARIAKSLAWESMPAPAKRVPQGPMRAKLEGAPADRKLMLDALKEKFGVVQ